MCSGFALRPLNDGLLWDLKLGTGVHSQDNTYSVLL
jgi:hypothetical protein